MKPIPNGKIKFSSLNDAIIKLTNKKVYYIDTSYDDIKINTLDIFAVNKTNEPDDHNHVIIHYYNRSLQTEHEFSREIQLETVILFSNKYLAYDYAKRHAEYLAEYYSKLCDDFEKTRKEIYNSKRKTFADVKVGDYILTIYPNGNTEKSKVKSIDEGLLNTLSFRFGDGEYLPIDKAYLNDSNFTTNNVLYTPIDE